MRRATGPRYFGPYQHGEKWRVHVVTGSGRERKTACEAFTTRALAEAFIAGARDETKGVTVRQAVDSFLEYKRARGLEAATIESYENRLWRLLGLPANANRPIRYVLTRGADLYAASVGCAADTHINGLIVGRMWGAWCVSQRLLAKNPFAAVETIGRKRKGSTKPRLTVDESRKLEAHCFADGGDQDRVLTYGYMMLGKRADELARLEVRDLDDNGWLLRIRKAKTEASVGAVAIPEQLREMLLGLAHGKAPDAPLFVNQSGERMSRFVARARVMATCKAAGVPVLPPQALRRTFTDNASRQGIALRTIAEMTGHGTPAVTRRSYISPERVASDQVERNLRVIAGGRK
jgi:integrase